MAWTRCSLRKFQQQKAELKKNNEDKDEEIKQLRDALNNTGAEEISALRDQTLALKEQIKDVRY